MSRFSQFRYSAGRRPGGDSLIGRILALVVGVLVLGVSVFVGAVFLAGFVGLLLIGGVLFAARVWWLKRKMERYQQEHGDLEGEYTVVREEMRRVERRGSQGRDRQ